MKFISIIDAINKKNTDENIVILAKNDEKRVNQIIKVIREIDLFQIVLRVKVTRLSLRPDRGWISCSTISRSVDQEANLLVHSLAVAL